MGDKIPTCEKCGHQFHGLKCETIMVRYVNDTVQRQEEVCECPSPFDLPVLYEDERIINSRRTW